MLDAILVATNNSLWFDLFAPPVGVLSFPLNSGSVTDTLDDETYNGFQLICASHE
jgi:hypothetical protein